MTDNQAYLRYILDCIDKIETYSANGKKAFIENTMIQDAVIRRLQNLAESTQRLSTDLKTETPDIDWRSISGLRNILVHNYLGGIDLNLVMGKLCHL